MTQYSYLLLSELMLFIIFSLISPGMHGTTINFSQLSATGFHSFPQTNFPIAYEDTPLCFLCTTSTLVHILALTEAVAIGWSNDILLRCCWFGNFGQFIAKALTRQGHIVFATSRSDYSEYCQQNGIQFLKNVDSLCEEQLDVLFFSPVNGKFVRSIPMHKLKPDTIFADVLSAKQFPKNLFLEVLPPGFGIVCTHPMFGPENEKNGWDGLPFFFDKVRIGETSAPPQKCDEFLSIFEQEVSLFHFFFSLLPQVKFDNACIRQTISNRRISTCTIMRKALQ